MGYLRYLRCFAYGILAVCLLVAPQAQAQESAGEVSGGFLAGKEIGAGNCSWAGVRIEPCSPWALGWNGAFAVHAADRWSLIGTVFGQRQSLDAELSIQEPSPRSLQFSAKSDTFALAGGVRVHGDRSASVRLFADLLFGYSRTSAALEAIGGIDPTALGDNQAVVAVSGPMLIPGVGVDVGVAERVAVRFQGDLPVVFAGGSTASQLRLGAGLVFAIGN